MNKGNLDAKLSQDLKKVLSILIDKLSALAVHAVYVCASSHLQNSTAKSIKSKLKAGISAFCRV